MAIDTKEKRASVIGVGRPYLRGGKFPVASPTVTWRASTGLSYGANGIAAPILGSNGARLVAIGAI